MYLAELQIKNFRQFGDLSPGFLLVFREGVTALVGENDTGKTAVIDAIRHALLTRDQDYMRLLPEDFHIDPSGAQASDITIICKLDGLGVADKAAFVEYLTYDAAGHQVLYIYWSAHRLAEEGSRRWVDIVVKSGIDGSGPSLDPLIRQLLATAYLRPLRDAEKEMSPGRGSRLSQILSNFPNMKQGTAFDPVALDDKFDATSLSLSGLADYLRYLVNQHGGVAAAQTSINTDYLKPLSLWGENLKSQINFVESGTEAARLRQILERLEIELLHSPTGKARGRYGLGSNNLLFMACELLLLGKERDGLPLLLIEEPEAHLHPQRQLRLTQFLEAAAKDGDGGGVRPVQVIVTTHSPHLASKIPLSNLVVIQNQLAYPLSEDCTLLSAGDYRFLERFLDVTKSNLFFAKGVIVVEGPGEAILLPAIARILGRDLTHHGVSLVNVGGTGLRRYAKIFQRKAPTETPLLIPVACIADMDIMPDCAPLLLEIVTGSEDPKWKSTRRKWKTKSEMAEGFADQAAGLADRVASLKANDTSTVKTFVANEWTLEYDLAFAGLGKEVYIAACMAVADDALNDRKKTREEVKASAEAAYASLESESLAQDELATFVYEKFLSRAASKAVAAQYLAEALSDAFDAAVIDTAWLESRLPSYLRDAIAFASTPMIIPVAGQ